MVKGFCEDCQSPQEIVPTDQPVGKTGSAMRWKFTVHPRESSEQKRGCIAVIEACPGSNKLV